jgi:hypothetical protein
VPIAGDTFFGINRSEDPVRLSAQRVTSGSYSLTFDRRMPNVDELARALWLTDPIVVDFLARVGEGRRDVADLAWERREPPLSVETAMARAAAVLAVLEAP